MLRSRSRVHQLTLHLARSPPQNNSADIQGQVCTAAAKYTNYPIPLVITEWGLYTGIKTVEFETAFYENQVATWAWSAGSFCLFSACSSTPADSLNPDRWNVLVLQAHS